MQKSFMQSVFKWVLIVVMVCIPGISMSQVNGLVCDFENDADTAAWDYVTDTTRLKWRIGSATSCGEGRSIYISADNGASNTYYGRYMNVFAYRTVNLAVGDYEYSYNWKGMGEGNFDFLRVALVADSVEIECGTSNGITRNSLPEGWIALDGGGKLNDVLGWTLESGHVDIAIAGNYKLVLYWQNDRSGVYNPPAAVDNISLIIPSCREPRNLAVNNILSDGATLTWGGTATDWEVEYMLKGGTLGADENEVLTTSDSTIVLTGLLTNRVYEAYVKGFCSDGYSRYAKVEFRTGCGDMDLPMVESFEWDDLDESPVCWTVNGGMVKVNKNLRSHATTEFGSKYVHMYGGCVLAMPHIGVAGNTLKMDIHVSNDGAEAGNIAVGFVSDLASINNAVYLDTIVATEVQTMYEVDFSDVNAPMGGYIVLKQIDNSSIYENAGCNIDNIYLRQKSNCMRPDELQVSGVTYNSARLQWSGVVGVGSYDVVYGKVNDPESISNMVENGILGTSLTIDALDPMTNYYVWVRSNCGTTYSDWRAGEGFTTQEACAKVENVRITSLNYSGFAMAWDYNESVGGEATQTEVGWKRMDEVDYRTQVVDVNYYIFQGLEGGTRYDVRLRTICGEDTAEAFMQTVATSLYGIQVGTGESFDDMLPIDCYYKNNYSQMLYKSSEIVGLDTIGGIAFNVDCEQNGYDRVWDVYMGHTSLTSLNTMDYLPFDSLTLVADSVTYQIRNGWSGITLDNPFAYDGSSNLVVVVNDHATMKSNGVYFKTHDGSSIAASNSRSEYNPIYPPSMIGYNSAADVIFMRQASGDGCDAPLIVVGDVTENSVELVWNMNNDGHSYQVEYRLTGADDWIVANNDVADSTWIVSGLITGMYYEFRVGLKCGTEVVYSTEVEATTDCGLITGFYSENFNGEVLNPCWVYGNNMGSENTPHLMYQTLYMNYDEGGYAIMPELMDEVSTMHVMFKIKSRIVGSRLVVAVGENRGDINSFEVIDTFATTSFEEFTPYECNLSSYRGVGKCIAFIALDKYIQLDDVVLETLSDCGIPSDITVSDISTNSATISWNNDAGNTLQWMIVYGEVGEIERDTTYAMVVDNSCVLNNLEKNMNYEVMVYNICGEDTVAALMPVLFRTECGTLVLPYYDDFNAEMADEYHPCWHTTEFHTYGSWTQETAPMIKNHGSEHGKVMMFGDNVDMITPLIENSIESIILSFDAKIDHTVYGGSLAIGYTTSTTDLMNAIYVDTIEFEDKEWGHYDVSFANAYCLEPVYIVFKNYDNEPQTDMANPSWTHYYNGYIDNVMISIDNGCEKVTNVEVSNITGSTADISFVDESATGDYTIGYSTENDVSDITMMQHFTTTTATLINLEGSTHYFVWVRKNCESGSSLWEAGPAFTTACGEIDELPYKENFDSYTEDVPEGFTTPSSYPNHTMPSCWTFENMAQSRTAFPRVYLCKPNDFLGYSDSAVCMMFVSGINTSVFAVMPDFTEHISNTEISFMYRHEGTNANNGTLTLGVMTDRTDTNSFIALQTYPSVTEMTEVSHNFRLDDLDINTDYVIAFRYMGHERPNFRLSMDKIVLKVSSDCITPEDLTVGLVTSQSIDLSWVGIANNYNIQYRPSNENVWVNAPTISGNYAVLTNLNPQTEYQIRIQANCGESVSDWTEEVTATTGCGAMELPYTENFNDYQPGRGTSTDTYPPIDMFNPTMPDCWSFPHMRIPTPIAFMTSAEAYANTGLCLFMMSDTLMPMYAVLPEMNAPINDLIIDFTYRNENVDEHNPSLVVGVMTNPMDGNTFIPLETMPKTTTKTNASHTFGLDNGLDENTTYYIAFKYGGTGLNGDQYYLSIDDVVVDYAASCHKPIRFRVDNVTASSASVHWYGDAANYEVNYRLTSEQSWTSAVTMNMDADLLGLEANSQYVVRVRALCDDGDQSEWTTEVLFNTECATMDLPYSEDFNDFSAYDFEKYCWNRYYGRLDSVMANQSVLQPAITGWVFSDGHPMSNGGTNLWINIWGVNIKDWAVSPQINLTSATSMEFDIARFDVSNNNVWQTDDKLVILATSDEGNSWYKLKSWDGTAFQSIPRYTESPMHITIDLSRFDGDAIRLAFYAESSVAGSDHFILIDNLEVTGLNEVNPNCDTPANLNVSDITDLEATCSWQGGANAYELQYRRENGWNWITVTANNSTYILNSLSAGTDYEWRVRAVCSEGEYSLWSEEGHFTTLGQAPLCDAVNYVSVNDIDTTSARVSWSAGGEEQAWEVEYGKADFAIGQGSRVRVTEMEYMMENLTPQSIYDVYVRAICGDNFYSEWSDRIQFSTLSGESPEGIDGIEGEYELIIYPNPTSGSTTIRMSGVEGAVKVFVIDINGRTISDETIECGLDCEKRVDVSGLAQGTYFVRVIGNRINSVRKLIVR